MHFSREVFDESAVEVHEAKETSNVSKVARFPPVSNSSSLSMIHAYMTKLNNHAEIFDVVAIELAFFGLQVQIIFFKMS